MIKYLRYIKEFGDVGIKVLFNDVIYKVAKCESFRLKKDKVVMNYLKNYFDNTNYSNENNENKYIFTLWWDGLEEAPILVKKCINTFMNVDGYQTIVLTKDNFQNFVKLPKEVTDKFFCNKFGITHLSDIIRFYLLHNYNCYWVDATIFLNDKNVIIDNYTTLSTSVDGYISNGKWTGFFLKSDQRYYNAYATICNYWKHNEILIDYFLVDYIIRYLYSAFMDFKNNIDNYSFHSDIYEMSNRRNDCVSEREYLDFKKQHPVNKLSWKLKYQINISDNKTIFEWAFCD